MSSYPSSAASVVERICDLKSSSITPDFSIILLITSLEIVIVISEVISLSALSLAF